MIKYNYHLMERVCRIQPIYYNVIGTSIVIAMAINIITSLVFLPRNSFRSQEIACLVAGSILLLLSGFNFIKLGMNLEGFLPRIFSDFADALRPNVDIDERRNFADRLEGDKITTISKRTFSITGKLFDECLRKNFSRVADTVQPAFLIAVSSLLLGLGLLVYSSPLLH